MTMQDRKLRKQESNTSTHVLAVVAVWAAVVAIALVTVRIWDARIAQPSSQRSTADVMFAMTLWILFPAVAIFVIRSLRRSDSILVVAARVFVLLLPLQFLGYGGRLGLQLGLVDVGDIFMKAYCILWLIMLVLAATVLTLSRLPNKAVNPSGGAGEL
jgi:hypothetical protein